MSINSDFTLDLNASKDPTNINKVVTNVYEEIDYYVNSNDDAWERKFRPRVKINGFDMASSEIEDVDFNAFRKWLNKVLRDQYAVDPKYVFYYSRKYDKQYPDNSVYQITGTFSKYADDNDNLVMVQLTIEFPDAHDVAPTVIRSDEFSMDENKSLLKVLPMSLRMKSIIMVLNKMMVHKVLSLVVFAFLWSGIIAQSTDEKLKLLILGFEIDTTRSLQFNNFDLSSTLSNSFGKYDEMLNAFIEHKINLTNFSGNL